MLRYAIEVRFRQPSSFFEIPVKRIYAGTVTITRTQQPPPPPVEVPPLIVNLLITKSSEAQVDKTVDIFGPLTSNYLAGTLANTLADKANGAGSRR